MDKCLEIRKICDFKQLLQNYRKGY